MNRDHGNILQYDRLKLHTTHNWIAFKFQIAQHSTRNTTRKTTQIHCQSFFRAPPLSHCGKSTFPSRKIDFPRWQNLLSANVSAMLQFPIFRDSVALSCAQSTRRLVTHQKESKHISIISRRDLNQMLSGAIWLFVLSSWSYEFYVSRRNRWKFWVNESIDFNQRLIVFSKKI